MADTLREYLVSLGFAVNEASLHRFQGVIAGTAGEAAKLGAEVASVGLAITDMVTQVARHFEDLYYVAQRNSATVAGIDAVSFAFRQVGLSSGEALSMVESFGHALRTNPGLRGLLAGMGVDDRDPQRAAEGLIDRLKRQFGETGYFAAARVASLYGLDERTFRTLWLNLDRLKAEEGAHRRRMREAGLDADEEARHFVDFTRVLNTVEDSFSILGTHIAHDWREPVQGLLTSMDHMVEGFNRADKASDGLLGRITGLIAAFGGASALMALLGRVFGFSVPTAVPLAGAGAAWSVIGNLEKGNDTGRPVEQGELDKLPWWRQLAVAFQQSVFGADPNQFLKGGKYGPGTPGTFGRSTTLPPSRVWGDEEAQAAGLYPSSTPTPRSDPRGPHSMVQHITQTNNINGAESPRATAEEISRAHRELGDALRNLYPKAQ